LGKPLRELNRRGVKKVQLFITDDLPGIENAIKMVYPASEWQLCVLHTVRNSSNKVRAKDRGLFAEDLKRIYRAETEEKAKEGILKLKERWGKNISFPPWTMKNSSNFSFLTMN
jgi:transposase-like protein